MHIGNWTHIWGKGTEEKALLKGTPSKGRSPVHGWEALALPRSGALQQTDTQRNATQTLATCSKIDTHWKIATAAQTLQTSQHNIKVAASSLPVSIGTKL